MVNPDPSSPHRKNLRIPDFDYSQPGSYYVSIVTQGRRKLFGQIVDGEMVLNDIGKMVEEVWVAIPEHFPNVELGEFVVMPNHFHGVITITVGARHAVPRPVSEKEGFGKPVSGSLSTILRSFKSATTKAFHEFSRDSEDRLWQRSFYEHVIQNERDYRAIYEYIVANPMNWEMDDEFNSKKG